MHASLVPPTHVLGRIEHELGLRDYQREALRSFVARGGRGIAHLATGTGKTRIGIGALRWARSAGHRAVVLVPTRALGRQWRDELLAHAGLADDEVQLREGRRRLRRHGSPAVIITTMQTAMRSPDRLRALADKRGYGLLIVDECHRAGAPLFSKALVDEFRFRLGLSATPERPFDPTGTRKLIDYFDGVAHAYGLSEAVAEGHLANYTYHVHSTYLEPDESAWYDQLTREIAHVVGRIRTAYPHAPGLEQLGELLSLLTHTGEDAWREELQELLFQRARIVKNARGKLALFGNLAHELVGRKTIVFTEEIHFAEELALVADQVGLDAQLYHSLMDTEQRDDALAAFRQAASGVLIAVRALDEGLDVPDAEVAVLAASSTSERQHIQRRGRVLRPLIARGKVAELHDFYVIGVDDARRLDRIREDATRTHFHGSDGPLSAIVEPQGST